jgi:hypothetical protein
MNESTQIFASGEVWRNCIRLLPSAALKDTHFITDIRNDLKGVDEALVEMPVLGRLQSQHLLPGELGIRPCSRLIKQSANAAAAKDPLSRLFVSPEPFC